MVWLSCAWTDRDMVRWEVGARPPQTSSTVVARTLAGGNSLSTGRQPACRQKCFAHTDPLWAQIGRSVARFPHACGRKAMGVRCDLIQAKLKDLTSGARPRSKQSSYAADGGRICHPCFRGPQVESPARRNMARVPCEPTDGLCRGQMRVHACAPRPSICGGERFSAHANCLFDFQDPSPPCH